jgi:hypothetical protein
MFINRSVFLYNTHRTIPKAIICSNRLWQVGLQNGGMSTEHHHGDMSRLKAWYVRLLEKALATALRGPTDLILVRHGQSEGNLAQDRSAAGDEEDWIKGFSDKHTSRYRLTQLGRDQAKYAGKWIRDNIHRGKDKFFDMSFTSEYIRAMETAALLDLPEDRWLLNPFLREKDKGGKHNSLFLSSLSYIDETTINSNIIAVNSTSLIELMISN